MLISHGLLVSSLPLLFPFSQRAVEYHQNPLGPVKVFEPLHFWTCQLGCVWNAIFWLKEIYAILKQLTSWQTPFKRQVNKTLLSHTTHQDGVRKCQGFEQKWLSALSKEIFPSFKAMPQPMPDCTLWNNIAVKLTNFISFSFHDNTAFMISRLIVSCFIYFGGIYIFFKCVFVFKRLPILFSTGCQLKLLLLQGKNIGVPIALVSFHSFTQSLAREEDSLMWFFRASYGTSGRHGH